MAAFTMRLPPTIQAHLASTELTNLKELAQMAACLWLCHAPQTVATLQVKEDQQKEDSSDVVTAMAAKKWPTLKGSPRDSRPLEKTARARAAAGCIRSMEKTATDVPTRRTAPGWETRWRGGGGRYLLWPQRPTSPCWWTKHHSSKMHVAVGGRRYTWDFLLADVALPIIGADFLRHFGLLMDLGQMRILACRGGLSQHLVQPSGSVMFATKGVVADQLPQVRDGKKHWHVGVVQPSPSLPTVEAPTSASLLVAEA